MKQTRTLTAFALALAAFLTIGAGVILLLAPSNNEEGGHAAAATPAAATEEPAAAPSQESGPAEFTLVENAPAIARPDQPSRITIPSIALDARVVEVGVIVEQGKPVWGTAAFAVGFHRGTALPGTKGNTVMAGHISSPVSKRGDIFRRLPEVRIGDRVNVFVGERRVAYAVTEIKLVQPNAVQVLKPTDDATLTLITCYPDNVYSQRLVVVGKLADGAT